MRHPFFALVGPPGAGKSTLLAKLKTNLSHDRCVFLCDSSGSGYKESPHVRFTTRVSALVQEGVHMETTAHSQLLLFWSRLVSIIQHDVVPNLRHGKCVIMDGFGGTVLTHAMYHAHNDEERAQLLELHKDMIRHCVVAFGAHHRNTSGSVQVLTLRTVV